MLNSGRLCPGAVALEAEATEKGIETSSVYADIGTDGHRWLELMISEGRESAEAFGEKLTEDFRLTLEEFWAWFEGSDLVPFTAEAEYLTERSIRWAEGDFEGTGTADLLVFLGGEAWVIDWKFYNDPSMLPPVHEDMQMYAYAVGAAKFYHNVEKVTVHRVLCYFNKADTLELESDTIKMAEEALLELSGTIHEGCDEFNVGAQCQMCFQRSRCESWLSQQEAIDTKAMAPYTGGEFSEEAQVLRFLLAAPVIEHLLKEGKEAAKAFVNNSGKALIDLTSGKAWGPKTSSRDYITDAAGCLGELVRKTSQDEALRAAKTSKSAMESVLKAANVPAKDRLGFINGLRDRGYIEKREADPRYEWRKLK